MAGIRSSPQSISIAYAPLGDHTSQLSADESGLLENVSILRRNQISTGRSLIKDLALTKLSLIADSVLSDKNGAPIWPNAFTGSISHSRQHCVVAIAKRKSIKALGIDIEPLNSPFEADDVEFIASDDELNSFSQDSEMPRSFSTDLLFSAKEAAFKCLYHYKPIDIGFRDLGAHWVSEGSMIVSLTSSRTSHPISVPVRWIVKNGSLLTLCWVKTFDEPPKRE